MLTQQIARNFIEQDLGISDFHDKLVKNPLGTLNKLIYEFHKLIPFQNLTVLLQKAGTMGVPDLNQVKEDVLKHQGGICYTNNVFMKYLLEAVGLTTYHIAGVFNPKHPNNHIATIVCDLERPGQRHAVDVGCGHPTFQAVELTDIPDIYRSAHVTYCFKRISPNIFVRYHATEPSKFPDQECFQINTTPRELSYFQEAMAEVYRDRFPKKLRVTRFYDDNKMVGFREVGDCARKLTFEGSATMQQELNTQEEIVNEIAEIMPAFSRSEITKAVENWQSNLIV